ncbi:MAG TPA: DUF4203 domain-containing protein [Candidatus Hydrogenedens sp.]|nr:DUF4203 domain-containing protein [Candidatus Hydrogenedens sp.]HOL18950.1 DUF4203 domain-containing protein [Candidatus Hydrogenedens sp.]HPP58998.1 DUF4203 domain-containing protein [Candidatus Hydrogenedens sp.]
MYTLFCMSKNVFDVEIMMSQLSPVLPILIAIWIIGFLCCFYGYRFLYFIIGACGFVTLFLTSWLLLNTLSPLPFLSIVVQLFISIIFGLVGVAISIFMYKVGVFLLGFLGAYIISFILTGLIDYSLLMVLIGCVGGVLSLVAERVVVVVATASVGSLMIVWAIVQFLEYGGIIHVGLSFEPSYVDMMSKLAWFGFSALGCSIQYKNINPQKSKSKKEDASNNKNKRKPKEVEN